MGDWLDQEVIGRLQALANEQAETIRRLEAEVARLRFLEDGLERWRQRRRAEAQRPLPPRQTCRARAQESEG